MGSPIPHTGVQPLRRHNQDLRFGIARFCGGLLDCFPGEYANLISLEALCPAFLLLRREGTEGRHIDGLEPGLQHLFDHKF